MSKSFSSRLEELKPLLPKGYQKTIKNSLDDVELWRIKKAFAGQSQPEDMLRKIFRVAARLSKQHLQEQASAKKVVEDLKEIAGAAE